MKTRQPHHWYWTGPNGRDYDIYDFPFIDTDGSFLILEMGIDITERKRADEALKQTLVDLERSNADLEQFAYVASHDLQEPLRNVASCVQLLGKKYKGKFDTDADQLLSYAAESSIRMKALIVALLAYSRISTRGNPFRPTSCEEVLKQTLEQMKPSIEEAGARITHDQLPIVVGDFTQLSQVFQNLVGNAIKFRREEPLRVHVSAVMRDSEWVFSVKDNGIGIEARHLSRIFVIFQRLHKREEYEGTGMGLAIVKKIIERHQGTVWVESEPQEGTTFYFTIPAKETNT
jgi:light-regulated signal transduction histidine kinase (bacteriophytochrome)